MIDYFFSTLLEVERVHVQQNSSPPTATRWEQAYQAFETPEQELRKFVRRLRSIGADRWDHHLRIVEVCSGRGTGMRAWHSLGFTKIVGVDYSRALLSVHAGPGYCVLGDAR